MNRHLHKYIALSQEISLLFLNLKVGFYFQYTIAQRILKLNLELLTVSKT